MFLLHALYRAPTLRKRCLKLKKPDKTVPKMKHMQYSVEDSEKVVAAVIDKKMVLVLLQKNLICLVEEVSKMSP